MIEVEVMKEKLSEKEHAILDREFNVLRKDITVSYVLLVVLGFLGIHKFYLGKIGMGILYSVTLGFFFLGIVYDLATLPDQVSEFNNKLEHDLIRRLNAASKAA